MALKRTMVESTETGERYWLLHWGLRSVVEYYPNTAVVVTNTYAICHNIETDAIEMFLPEAITIIGREDKV